VGIELVHELLFERLALFIKEISIAAAQHVHAGALIHLLNVAVIHDEALLQPSIQ
jgi:hypothetical protein